MPWTNFVKSTSNTIRGQWWEKCSQYCATPWVLQFASTWRGVPQRNGRSTSGDFSPGRVTLGVKAIPLCPAKNCSLKHLIGLIFHTVSVISFSAKVINLWWLKFDLLFSGIVKAEEPTTEDASDTDDAEAVIIINNAKLVKNE
ncbi:hypothetical protein TNCV_386681 [Trichonephila clavipes]|nr:hypothetical protein TNCV_386681 [Trichonephila clavipes]